MAVLLALEIGCGSLMAASGCGSSTTPEPQSAAPPDAGDVPDASDAAPDVQLDAPPDSGDDGTLPGCVPQARAPGCTLEVLGDSTKLLDMEIIAFGADGKTTPVADGDPVALILPPQGGRVIFAGIHATNLDPCGVTLTGVLRDLQTKKIQIDMRTTNLEPAGDGWGQSSAGDISTFANIPTCPNQWSETDLYGTEYELEITATDINCRTATKTIHVVPECAQPSTLTECLCICAGGYMLGEPCPQ